METLANMDWIETCYSESIAYTARDLHSPGAVWKGSGGVWPPVEAEKRNPGVVGVQARCDGRTLDLALPL